VSFSLEKEREGLREYLLEDEEYSEIIRLMVRDAVEAEREACAEIVESLLIRRPEPPTDSVINARVKIAEAIRARGEE
jgi:hypothetical protein